MKELERHGLQNDYNLSNITFDEMMSVVNEVGNDQLEATPKTGKLLYENENTDWVGQLVSSSIKNANRITALIDLHLGRLAKIPKVQGVEKEKLIGFNISDFISHNKESLPNG